VTVQGVAYFGVSLPMGILADKVSRKKLLVAGTFLNGLAMLGLAFAPSYGWAIAWMALAGLAGSFFHPAATPLMVALFPERPGWALGRAAIGVAFGFFIAQFYSGWRAQAAGWRQPCLELAIAGIVAAVLFQLFAREPHDAPHATERATEHSTRSQWKMLMAVALVALAFSLRDFGTSGITTFNSLFLQRGLGFDAKATGAMLGLMFLTGMLSNPLLGALSDKHRFLACTVTILCTAALAVVIPWASRGWIWLALCFYGFFTLANYPITEAALMESVPDVLRGRTFGVFITVGGTIASFAHWAMGKVADALQHRAAETNTSLVAGDFAPWYLLLAALIAVSVIGVHGIRWLRKLQAA
jgi:FSR family fosmidomycin resistance protein-like MFS transporter